MNKLLTLGAAVPVAAVLLPVAQATPMTRADYDAGIATRWSVIRGRCAPNRPSRSSARREGRLGRECRDVRVPVA